MTNVPQEIRDAWADIYKLFDVNYGMNGSQDAWEKYWLQAAELIKKHGDNVPMLEILYAVAHMIEEFVKKRNGEKSIMEWKKDEDYPYPKM